MPKIILVGAGIAGLVAAVACAERGAEVVVHEAHGTIGGRARATAPPYIAQDGPHVLYADGPHWTWLAERDLVGPVATLPMSQLRQARFRHGGRLRGLPPTGLIRLLMAQRSRPARWTGTSSAGPLSGTAQPPPAPRGTSSAWSPTTTTRVGCRRPWYGICWCGPRPRAGPPSAT